MLWARLAALCTAVSLLSSCGLISRSSEANNVEDDEITEHHETIEVSEEKPNPGPQTASLPAPETSKKDLFKDPVDVLLAPQTIQGGLKSQNTPGNPTLEAAQRLFNQALREQREAAFLAAYDHWKQFIERYTGLPGHEQALHNLGLTLFHLGRPAEAIEPLQGLTQTTKDSELATDSRLLLAECLLATNALTETLALTFDVMPDLKAETQAGLGRKTAPEQPNLKQKIRLYTLRGRVYASLGNEKEAEKALTEARKLLETAKKSRLSTYDRRALESHLGFRQIEVLELICARRVLPNDTLSEQEFLAYADAYYGCAAPARELFCQVQKTADHQLKSQVLRAYRRLVEEPLKLKDRLPPPARTVRKKEQRSHYEREMKVLIEKTVEERSKAFNAVGADGACAY